MISFNFISFQTAICFFVFPLIPIIISFHGDEDDDANQSSNKAIPLNESYNRGNDGVTVTSFTNLKDIKTNEENDSFELQVYSPEETSFFESMYIFYCFTTGSISFILPSLNQFESP